MFRQTRRMSNIGKKILKVPAGVTLQSRAGLMQVDGSRGSLQFQFPKFVNFNLQEGAVQVTVEDPKNRKQRAMWGTARQLVQNMVVGVTDGFIVPLRIVGVGYRALLEDGKLSLRLGFSHPVILDIPEGVQVTIPTPQRVILQGNSLEQITQFAAKIRRWRKPEPYNQKGIFVGDETIKKKEGKKR